MSRLVAKNAVVALAALSLGLVPVTALDAAAAAKHSSPHKSSSAKISHSPDQASTVASKKVADAKKLAGTNNDKRLIARRNKKAEADQPTASAEKPQAKPEANETTAPVAPVVTTQPAPYTGPVATDASNTGIDTALASVLRDITKALRESDEAGKFDSAFDRAAFNAALATLDQSVARSAASSNRIVSSTTKDKLEKTVAAESWESGEIALAGGAHASMNVLWAKKINGLINISIAGNCSVTKNGDSEPVEFVVVVNGKSALDSGFDIQSQSKVNYWLGKLTGFTVDAGGPAEANAGRTTPLKALLTERRKRWLTSHPDSSIVAQQREASPPEKKSGSTGQNQVTTGASATNLAAVPAPDAVSTSPTAGASSASSARSLPAPSAAEPGSTTQTSATWPASNAVPLPPDPSVEHASTTPAAAASASNAEAVPATSAAERVSATPIAAAPISPTEPVSTTPAIATDSTAQTAPRDNHAETAADKAQPMLAVQNATPQENAPPVEAATQPPVPTPIVAEQDNSTTATDATDATAAAQPVPPAAATQPVPPAAAIQSVPPANPTQPPNYGSALITALPPAPSSNHADRAATESVTPRNPSANAVLLVPDKVVAGENMTVSVVSARDHKAEPNVALTFNGSPVIAGKDGRASFQVPEEAPPGPSLQVALATRQDYPPANINVIQPLLKPLTPQPPRIDHVSDVATQGRIIIIDGHNFNGTADRNLVTLDSKLEARVLVASPVQLKVLLPSNAPYGHHAISVSAHGLNSNNGDCDLVSVQVQPMGNADKTNRWMVKVLGTQSKMRVRVSNTTPSVVKLVKGNDQTLITPGGSNNLVLLNGQRLSKGLPKLTTVVEPLQ